MWGGGALCGEEELCGGRRSSVGGGGALWGEEELCVGRRGPGVTEPEPSIRPSTLDLCEPVCRICCEKVEIKRTNTTNKHLHLKHNHPMQFSQLRKRNMDREET